MNLSSILGLCAALGVFVTAVLTSSSNYKVFLNIHAFFIVIGGTAAATLLSFPLSQITKIAKVFFNKILGKHSVAINDTIIEIVSLSVGLKNDENYLSTNYESIKNIFLKEAVQMQIEGGLSEEALETIIQKRAEIHYYRYEDEAGMFKTMARFPPAFGLLGAVLGMIALMQGLGSPDSFKQIGPAMAISMVATLYGVAAANFFLIPLGENLSKLNKQDQTMRQIVIDGVRLLRKKEHPLLVEEHLKSYLLPGERMAFNKRAS